MTNVKWLSGRAVLDRPFDGMQQLMSYRPRQEESEDGIPLTRMLPRALLAPPGIADFPTRSRTVAAGECGRTWREPRLEHDDSPWAWCLWSLDWTATAGDHELRCRARDAAGNSQPDEPAWNLGGYANNAVQRVAVTVVAPQG